jgi:uncharacterized membrane protein
VQEEFRRQLLEQLLRHRGKLAGAVVGLIFGWIVIALGVLRALFLLACILVGVYVGARADEGGRVWPFYHVNSGRWRKD